MKLWLNCGLSVTILLFYHMDYCAILINSAGPVMHYTPAEILVSALRQGHRYIAQKIRQVTAGGLKFWGICRLLKAATRLAQ
jgi:hypothetical protein